MFRLIHDRSKHGSQCSVSTDQIHCSGPCSSNLGRIGSIPMEIAMRPKGMRLTSTLGPGSNIGVRPLRRCERVRYMPRRAVPKQTAAFRASVPVPRRPINVKLSILNVQPINHTGCCGQEQSTIPDQSNGAPFVTGAWHYSPHERGILWGLQIGRADKLLCHRRLTINFSFTGHGQEKGTCSQDRRLRGR